MRDDGKVRLVAAEINGRVAEIDEVDQRDDTEDDQAGKVMCAQTENDNSVAHCFPCGLAIADGWIHASNCSPVRNPD